MNFVVLRSKFMSKKDFRKSLDKNAIVIQGEKHIEIIIFKITAKRSFIIHIQIKTLHIDSQIIVELKSLILLNTA